MKGHRENCSACVHFFDRECKSFLRMALKSTSNFAVVCFKDEEIQTQNGEKDKDKQLAVDLVSIKWLSDFKKHKGELMCTCAYPPQEKLNEVQTLAESGAKPGKSWPKYEVYILKEAGIYPNCNNFLLQYYILKNRSFSSSCTRLHS